MFENQKQIRKKNRYNNYNNKKPCHQIEEEKINIR